MANSFASVSIFGMWGMRSFCLGNIGWLEGGGGTCGLSGLGVWHRAVDFLCYRSKWKNYLEEAGEGPRRELRPKNSLRATAFPLPPLKRLLKPLNQSTQLPPPKRPLKLLNQTSILP